MTACRRLRCHVSYTSLLVDRGAATNTRAFASPAVLSSGTESWEKLLTWVAQDEKKPKNDTQHEVVRGSSRDSSESLQRVKESRDSSESLQPVKKSKDFSGSLQPVGDSSGSLKPVKKSRDSNGSLQPVKKSRDSSESLKLVKKSRDSNGSLQPVKKSRDSSESLVKKSRDFSGSLQPVKKSRWDSMQEMASVADDFAAQKKPFNRNWLRMRHEKKQFSPSEEDLQQLNLEFRAYWYRIWFLRYCANKRDLDQGSRFHAGFLREGDMDSHVLIGNALVEMYGKCGEPDRAYAVFLDIKNKNVCSWNFIIGAFARSSRSSSGRIAISLFRTMNKEGVKPNEITFANVINACSSAEDLKAGKVAHGMVAANGLLQSDIVVGNSLINMYSSCMRLDEARRTFEEMPCKNLITWTQLLAAYAHLGHCREAILIHRRMDLEGVKPDRVTFVAVLDACAGEAAQAYGNLIHNRVYYAGFVHDVVAGTALLNMYGRCGRLDLAWRIFNRIRKKNVVSWTAMITAYAQNGHLLEALKLFEKMSNEGIRANEYTLVGVLDACAALGALEYGRKAHRGIVESGIKEDGVVGDSLVNFYGKCGSLDAARSVFVNVRFKGPDKCSSIVSAYAQHGHIKQVLELLHCMNVEGDRINDMAFVGVLNACSYAGLLKELRRHFHSMITDYGITPSMDHYKPVMDLFGRKGRLAKMEDLINKMPFQPGVRDWLSLLAACEVHKDVQRAKLAAKKALKLDFKDHAPHELLANIYLEEDMLEEAEKEIEKMKANKMHESSFIEVQGVVHKFVEGDMQNRFYRKLERFLHKVSFRLAAVGHVFKSSRVDLDGDEEEERPRHHSERMAVAFGILNTGDDVELGIVNHHRMCSDCHTVMKYVSMVFGRKIIVRDASRFHHFEEGICSCKDYW